MIYKKIATDLVPKKFVFQADFMKVVLRQILTPEHASFKRAK